MGRDLVRDDAILDVLLIRQTEMLFRRDVTEHRRSIPADHRGADRACYVIVAGRDVRNQRAERVERRFIADLELLVDVLFDQVHRNVSRSLDHHLDVMFPGDLRELAERLEFRELGGIVCIGLTSRDAIRRRARS